MANLLPRQADFGPYFCQAANAQGTAQGTVDLDQTNMPIPEAAFAGNTNTTHTSNK